MTASYRRSHRGTVSLMIKACAQDAPHAERLVRHIIGQLGDEPEFIERFVVVDPRRDAFLRQYGTPDLDALCGTMNRLAREGVIDHWILGPTDSDEITRINHEWFAVRSAGSHSVTGVPVAPQLAGFERARGDYVLQLDIDAMIRRRDRRHDFLSDMLYALDGDERNVSVSFNIAHGHIAYRRYDAPPGGYVPEVRFGLIDRRKLLAERPLPNTVGSSGSVELTWYRSLERHQRARGLRSVRGGDGRSFFVHPMNTVKRAPEKWMRILDSIERGLIPHQQFDHPDLVEDDDSWEQASGDRYECLVHPPEELLPLACDALRRTGRALVILRHGRKRSSISGGSWSDLQSMGLAEDALADIDAFAAGLPVRPRRILSSPLPRCRQTAERLATATGATPQLIITEALLGGRFGGHDDWLTLKGRLGWSQLVERWIAGAVPAEIVTPYSRWIEEVGAVLETFANETGLNLIVSQGYVTSALAHSLTGRVEMRGGALHGFVWPKNPV